MAREVFDNSMTAHVWAQQNQPSGRSSNGNFSFDCAKLYSYRTVIGYILPNGTPLYTAENYSITTNRHMRELHSAIGWRNGYSMPNLDSLVPALETLRRALRDKDSGYLRRARADILAHLEKYAGRTGAEVAAVLLRLCGVRDAEQRWSRIAATAERNRLAAVERGKRKLRAQRLEHAKQAAASTPQSLADWKRRTLLEWNAESTAQKMALQLFHARNEAKAAGWKVIQRKCNAVLAEVRAFREMIHNNEGIIYSHKQLRHDISDLRNWMQPDNFKRYSSGGIEKICAAWGRVAGNGKGLQPEQRQRIADFVHQQLARVPAMRHAEQCQHESERQVERLEQILRQRERAMREEEQRKAWFDGVPAARWRGRDADGNAYMRIVGDTLQTSEGAEVPLSHAVRVFRLVKAMREKWYLIDGKPGTDASRTPVWTRNGHVVRVGHFQVDRINADGSFTAGCHAFAWDEIERVAKVAGVYDEAPDTSAIERK
jgi:hypothetical protein